LASVGSLSRISVNSFSPIREEVFARLRQAILAGELKPGTRLVERELAAQLGVSRTPVREAFRKLELEGLVSQTGRRTLVVTQVSAQDMREVFQIRAALEGLAAAMAAENAGPRHLTRFRSIVADMERCLEAGDLKGFGRLNDRFNETLYEAAGSARLSQMLESLREYVSRLTRVGYDAPGRPREALAEHAAIVDAIAARDAEAARQAATGHVQHSQKSLLRTLSPS
jgi:DNA-binding GntR family transcriptional regulator